MSKTRGQLVAMAARLGTISGNANLAAVADDLNTACQIVANYRDWPELYKTDFVSLTASDGDIAYELDADVDEVEQLRITSPSSYACTLGRTDKIRIRQVIPDKTLCGRTAPSRWYFIEPTISSVNVETKNITFDYLPDQAYTVTYSYKAGVPDMDDDSKYPFFDGSYHHILVPYAVWKYAERTADPSLNPNYWANEWERGLEMMKEQYQSQAKYLLPIAGPDEIL